MQAVAGVGGTLGNHTPQDPFVEWLAAGQRDGACDDVPVEWLVTAWVQLVVGGGTAADRYGIDIEDAAGMAVDAAVRAFAPR